MSIWLGIFIYVFLQLLIGFWVSKRIESESDYFLAGRKLGLGLATFSIFATWFGAEACIGSAGEVFKHGLSGSRADPFGYTICLFLMGTFFASQLWKRKLTTLADLYRERYSPLIENLAIWIMIPSSLIWAAAQMRAFGQILSATTSIDIEVALTIAATLVIVYTFLGGLLGDVITDFIQGVVLAVGLILLFIFTIPEIGGFSKILQIPSHLLNFSKPDETIWQTLDAWMIPILGSLVAQELISRILACRSGETAKRASLYAGCIYFSLGIIPIFLALVSGGLVSGFGESDQFLPLLAKTVLPHGLFVIFIGALISAILSTVDSTLLTISALVSHNFLSPLYSRRKARPLSEIGKVKFARFTVVVAGVAAYLLAVRSTSIYEMVELASSLGTAGILVITIFSLFSKYGGTMAAATTLVVGVLMFPLAENVFHLEAPFLATIAASTACYLLAGLLEWRLMRWVVLAKN